MFIFGKAILHIQRETELLHWEKKGTMSLMWIILTLFNTTDSVAESRLNESMNNM